MPAGRKPIPSRMKVIKGTDQPCRMNPNEPQPKTDNIRKPETLSVIAAQHWDTVCEQLLDAQVMTNLDVDALALYCEAYARWIDANDVIRQSGPVIRSPSGYPVQSPYMSIANKAFEQMKGMLTEFGMTPSSRTKVSVSDTKQEEKDPWGTFGARR